ncbi:MAG: hypothetical protein GX085_06490 [Firmicutes bacterium]|nr:hypothetical protein [Bacillota bacterium]
MFRCKSIKKGLSFLLLLLFLAGQPVWGQIADLPPGHWAYEAVKKLVDKGYLQLYDDGTFRGNFPVDRFTLATVVAKLLVVMEEGPEPADLADVELLRKLTNEFRGELVLLAAKDEELAARVLQLEEKQLVLSEELTKGIAGQREEMNRLLQPLQSDYARLESELLQLRRDLEKEKQKNRTYMLIAGFLGLLIGYGISSAR